MFWIVLDWEAFKNWLSDTVHLSHISLHLLLGVLLTIVIGWLMRVQVGSWRPWWAVFALEMLNETSDFTRYIVSGWPWTPWATLRDIAATMLPPLILLLIARRVRTTSANVDSAPVPDGPSE